MKTHSKHQQFSQLALFAELTDDPTYFEKRMFGGLALYFGGQMVAVLMEDSSQNYYKDKVFDFPIWNGLLLPTHREHHPQLLKAFPSLFPHPVLGKWLYLPLEKEDFEETTEKLISLILRRSVLIGITPSSKKKSKKRKASST